MIQGPRSECACRVLRGSQEAMAAAGTRDAESERDRGLPGQGQEVRFSP